jgi:hypothetical protein
MANPNWQADFERALMEEDRSDPSSKSVFQNRGLAATAVVTGIIALLIGLFCTYGVQDSQSLSADEKDSFVGFGYCMLIAAAVQIPMGCCGLALLRRKKPLAPPAVKPGGGGPPIGW